jgi:hypothetical protein
MDDSAQPPRRRFAHSVQTRGRAWSIGGPAWPYPPMAARVRLFSSTRRGRSLSRSRTRAHSATGGSGGAGPSGLSRDGPRVIHPRTPPGDETTRGAAAHYIDVARRRGCSPWSLRATTSDSCTPLVRMWLVVRTRRHGIHPSSRSCQGVSQRMCHGVSQRTHSSSADSSPAGFLAREGCTLIGSPGIFG